MEPVDLERKTNLVLSEFKGIIASASDSAPCSHCLSNCAGIQSISQHLCHHRKGEKATQKQNTLSLTVRSLFSLTTLSILIISFGYLFVCRVKPFVEYVFKKQKKKNMLY